MVREEKLILMCKDYEVLSFSVTFGEEHNIKVNEKLAHYDKAPYGMNDEGADIDRILLRFFNSRVIAHNRWDYKKIIDATGCESSFELSFKGHGLSLTNHYWFKREGENLKYDDINFFTNKWDDSFARMVLSGNYDGLKDVDLNVPDIVTPGWSIKGWLYEDGPKLYKLGIVKDHYEDCLGEVLCSRLARRIMNPKEVLEYKLGKIYGKYASISSPMISTDEELIPLSDIVPMTLFELYIQKNGDKRLSKDFFNKIKELGLPDLYDLFIKIACLRDLCFVADLHFNNISMIRNINTGKLKVAPIYDLAGAFGSSKTGREFALHLNKGSYALIYFYYNDLDPEWDYSWYDPDKLIGFEDEIVNVLSKSDFYTDELIHKILDIYHIQKSSLDKMVINKSS